MNRSVSQQNIRVNVIECNTFDWRGGNEDSSLLEAISTPLSAYIRFLNVYLTRLLFISSLLSSSPPSFLPSLPDLQGCESSLYSVLSTSHCVLSFSTGTRRGCLPLPSPQLASFFTDLAAILLSSLIMTFLTEVWTLLTDQNKLDVKGVIVSPLAGTHTQCVYLSLLPYWLLFCFAPLSDFINEASESGQKYLMAPVSRATLRRNI